MKENLARQMRHSIKIAETEYNKIHNVDFEPTQPLEIQEVRAPPALPPPLEKEHFNIKAWSKNYRESHKDEIKQKRMDNYTNHKNEILRKKYYLI